MIINENICIKMTVLNIKDWDTFQYIIRELL